jgi:acetyltransferase
MRILGPKCMGLIVPQISLNASLAHTTSLPGKTAFLSQSDSLFTTVLDWAKSHGIGFSHMISLGAQIDVICRYHGLSGQRSLVRPPAYVESIHDARVCPPPAPHTRAGAPPGPGLAERLAELGPLRARGAIGANALP